MSITDLTISRFTFGPRFGDPDPLTAANPLDWLAAQFGAPSTDDPSVLTRLGQVKLPITITAKDGTSTTETRGLNYLFKTSAELIQIYKADTSANRAEIHRPADEVSAARWIRAAFSPWQIREVMVDFWHNHFSVDAYQQGPIALMWPIYDQLIRSNALGNFRAMLGATAKSTAMMYYLNQNASFKAHPNENYAREVMELHTLGIDRYLGETTPAGAAGTGYSDQDVIEAARVLTGWTIGDGSHKAADGSKPLTGEFLFDPSEHDTGAKTIFSQTYPAGVGQAEGERLLDALAYHPGTALTIATKLYRHFVQDTPPAGDTLIQRMASTFQQYQTAPDQVVHVLQTLIAAPEFAASAGMKVKTPFEFLISAMRATGAEINPQPSLGWALQTMGAPLFRWPAPNGMPDIAPVWTGTNGMLRRWTLSDQLMAAGTNLLLEGSGTLFTATEPATRTPRDGVVQIAQSMLSSTATLNSLSALLTYAGSNEVLGAKGAITDPKRLNAGLRRLAGAVASTPEFQIR